MKRRFSILTAALALLMTFAIPMGMKGQKTHTIGWGTATGGAGTYTNFTATSGAVEGVISFETAKNDAQTAPAYNANNSDLRLYYASNGEGGSITIRPASTVTITNAVITTSISPSVAYYVDGGDAVNITATNNIYTISEISATSALTIQNVNTSNTQLRIKTIALTYTTSDSQPTCTVTFDAGEGTFVANNDFPNESNAVETGTYILPSATRDGYTFNGWALGEDTYEGGTTYMVNADVDFVASYTENGGESETATATLTQSNLGLTGSYSSNDSKTIDGITYVHTDLMKNSTNIQAKASTGTIKNTTAYPGDIISVAITHSGTGRATTINGSVDGTNWNQVATGNGSITADFSGKGYKYFQITRGSNAAYWETIEILYSTTSSSLNQSDLAISSPTADLSFDLYNNPTAQVITYTSSSTGAITITPTESIYFSYVHDATAKTITVTPLAVTPDAQTITIDQEADDSYYGGTATFTVSVVNSDPNLPGTENNPYTVAQARTAIDAGTGTQGVYATGIVSAIPTAWSNDFNNITFNFVDNVGDNDFLQAYRCVSGTGIDASTVVVGDVVVVYGNLIKYGSTYEFGQGCQLVSLTHPVVTTPTVTVTPNTINAPFAGADGTLVLSYENITDFISFDYYFCDANGGELEGNDPDWIYAEINEPGEEEHYTLSYIINANQGEARSAYFKVYTTIGDELNPEEVYAIVTVNQEAYVAPTYAELPFSFNGVKADIEGTDGLYEEGLATDYNATNYPTTKLKFDSTGDWLLLQFDERPGTLTFNIKGNSFSGSTFALQTSENGVDFTTLKSYTNNNFGEDVYPEEFTDLGENIRYIKWVYTTKSSGNVGLGNIALAKYVEPQQYTLTVEPFENLDLITFVNDEMVMEGEGEIQVVEGDQIMLSVVALEGFEMETLMVNGVDHVNDIADDFTYSFEMPSENVTISATAMEDVPPTPGEWVMVSLNDLTENDVFVIVGVYDEDESSFAMANNSTTAPSAVDVTMVGNTLSGDIAENLKWNLSIGEDGYTFYPNGETETWLYCNNTNNGVRVGTNENNVFTMTPEGYLFNNATSRYIGIYNRQDWRSYTSINNNIKNQTFAFYKRVDEGSLVTYTLDIEGYGDDENPGGWHLIASPVSMIRPTAENGFLTDEYDLYRFDQTNEKEWCNYKKNHFNLVSGHGYLYASQENTTLTFTGVPCTGNRKEVKVTYDENAVLAGFNLVGNPFNNDAYLVDANGTALAYIKMNEDGDGFMTVEDAEPIAKMEAVFYQATANDNSVYFSTEYRTAKSGHLDMTVNRGRGMVDNAIIRFGKGNTLEKFSFREGSTKVYIPQDGKDYAVVNADGEGEMPISFQAENNGTYSLNFSTKYVEFSYLHLIDNLTGNDIDLLATPSYTFEANATDYASRFRLVFSTSNTDSDNFAFISNGQIIINGQGSTVQVYDVTGRMIGSHNNVNHIATEGMSAGVYMLRLVNGTDVKTQKIVVK